MSEELITISKNLLQQILDNSNYRKCGCKKLATKRYKYQMNIYVGEAYQCDSCPKYDSKCGKFHSIIDNGTDLPQANIVRQIYEILQS